MNLFRGALYLALLERDVRAGEALTLADGAT
jgi:hypothetical protein